MGKDYKQQAEYDYLNGNGRVPWGLLQRLRRKFWRHNFDIGFYRWLRNKIRYENTETDE